jgi:4-amino-4-deoxy-L-arabinose transferase-like glycosyltransferase
MGSILMREAAPAPAHSRPRRDGWWYAGAVGVGSVLMVAAAINQPYNQNELEQMAPYGSDSIDKIIHGTRQPPLDPLLGALVQHLLGEGQLRQRLVPVLAGMGTLVLMSLLLRRLGMGGAGAFGVWVLATAPLMVRYSAYTRPYALPLFLMTVFGYAAQRWLEERQRWWLVLAAAAAAALPLARVPEPTVFLATTAVVLAWFAHRGRYTWSQAWPLVAISIGALVLVGYPEFRSLESKTSRVFDPSPSGVIDRFGSGVHELVTFLLPLLGTWLPWWPVTVLMILAALALPESRRRLFRWWVWWPVLMAPVVFALAFHFLNPFSFDVRTYRPRFAYFFLPAYILVVVALASVFARATSQRLRVCVRVLLGAALLSQLPATANAVLNNEAADYGQAAEVLTQDLPADAIVLYDAPSPAGLWRQPFSARPRYMANTPFAGEVSNLARHPRRIPKSGPVYVLILDSECAHSVLCNLPAQRWDQDVPGWIRSRFDRFTLYEPTEGQSGRQGAIDAMVAFAKALGPDLGYPETFAAARLLKLQGNFVEGKALIHGMYAQAGPEVAKTIRDYAQQKELNPFT